MSKSTFVIETSSKPIYKHSIHNLEHDSVSLTAAATTIALAFDHDPLIAWLRPSAPSWGLLEHSTLKWQRRRLAWAQVSSLVVRVSIRILSEENGVPNNVAKCNRTGSEDDEFGGIGILHPPKQKASWKWRDVSRVLRGLTLRLKDWFNPAPDHGSDMKRVERMFSAHKRNFEKQAAELSNQKMWYLEVCCARASVQGKGVGRKLMEWVVEQVGEAACLLECTDEKNVAFYQRFGFEVAEVAQLRDGGDVVNTWIMVRS